MFNILRNKSKRGVMSAGGADGNNRKQANLYKFIALWIMLQANKMIRGNMLTA